MLVGCMWLESVRNKLSSLNVLDRFNVYYFHTITVSTRKNMISSIVNFVLVDSAGEGLEF